jgi:hypothetical protein
VQPDARQGRFARDIGKPYAEGVGIPRQPVTLEDQRIAVRSNPGGHEALRLFDAMAAKTIQGKRRERNAHLIRVLCDRGAVLLLTCRRM